MLKGYKVFDRDWTCNGKQYTCPGIFEEKGEISICEHGMHFCRVAAHCFNYYGFNSEYHVAEVIAHGDVVEEDDKCCTNKLEIVRELTWHEVLELANTGKGCTGKGNSGNYNSGNGNSGSSNSGNFNSGDKNSGEKNSGNRNSGKFNSGDDNSGLFNSGDKNSGSGNSGNSNSGHWNTGNFNSGDFNSGNWNITCFSNGCFNTVEPKIYLFDKPSDWTFNDWLESDAEKLLNQINAVPTEWISASDMTAEEKEAHLEYKTTGGYLKKVDIDMPKCAQIWWDKLSEGQRNTIRAIPNFDPDIFFKITGIRCFKKECI